MCRSHFGSSDGGSVCAAMRPRGSKAKGATAFATYILLPAGLRSHFPFVWSYICVFILGFVTGCSFILWALLF